MKVEIKETLNGYLVRSADGSHRVDEVRWHDIPVDVKNLKIEADLAVTEDVAYLRT